MGKTISIQDFSPHLFWDVDLALFDLIKYQSFFITRVLEYGTMDDWKLIVSLYGMDNIKEAALKAKNLDAVTLSFVSTIFNIDKSEFTCYKNRQLLQNSWNS
ncbi:MAG: hypothetical protein IPK18_11610 [Sphingobacteriales bacterium]|jgi:hypothetical protein|nr:MAG: hypothetical protein IPK18_11610 [Sphingobacteriales bacterium]